SREQRSRPGGAAGLLAGAATDPWRHFRPAHPPARGIGEILTPARDFRGRHRNRIRATAVHRHSRRSANEDEVLTAGRRLSGAPPAARPLESELQASGGLRWSLEYRA